VTSILALYPILNWHNSLLITIQSWLIFFFLFFSFLSQKNRKRRLTFMPTSQMRRLLCSRWPWPRLTAKFWARDSSCNKRWKQLQLKLRALTTWVCRCPICLCKSGWGNSDPKKLKPLCGRSSAQWCYRELVDFRHRLSAYEGENDCYPRLE